jgi:hypothetical protein
MNLASKEKFYEFKESNLLYQKYKLLLFSFLSKFFTSMGNCNCTTDSEKEKLAEIINEEPSAPIEKKPS